MRQAVVTATKEEPMPKFIDFHAHMPPMPPDMQKMMQEKVRAGKPDQFGVKPINAYFTKDGQGYCISEGPSADAVCKSHEAGGVQLGKGDVHEVVGTLV
jgi:hypothetical protein